AAIDCLRAGRFAALNGVGPNNSVASSANFEPVTSDPSGSVSIPIARRRASQIVGVVVDHRAGVIEHHRYPELAWHHAFGSRGGRC
ncbi:MAG: hypothetical protein ACXVFQ_20010, partial [Solirubrobacteraceae bacterium]